MTLTRKQGAIAAATCLLLAGLVVLAVSRAGASRRGDRVVAHLGAATLSYPPAYARFGPGRAGGMLDRIEIAFSYPDLRPAGDAAAALPADDDVEPNARQLIFLTLRPENETVDPADRTAQLYARFLQSDVWQEDNGLVMRRFETGSPYEREELHFVPPEGRVFAARCMRPTQPPSDLPSTCLAGLRVSGLDVDVRFSPTLLSQWDALTDGARRLVNNFLQR